MLQTQYNKERFSLKGGYNCSRGLQKGKTPTVVISQYEGKNKEGGGVIR